MARVDLTKGNFVLFMDFMESVPLLKDLYEQTKTQCFRSKIPQRNSNGDVSQEFFQEMKSVSRIFGNPKIGQVLEKVEVGLWKTRTRTEPEGKLLLSVICKIMVGAQTRLTGESFRRVKDISVLIGKVQKLTATLQKVQLSVSFDQMRLQQPETVLESQYLQPRPHSGRLFYPYRISAESPFKPTPHLWDCARVLELKQRLLYLQPLSPSPNLPLR